MKSKMRLVNLQAFLTQKKMEFSYWEENDCASIDFTYRGLNYHVWEYDDGSGAQSNVLTPGRWEDYSGNYEEDIINILRSWEGL